MNRLIIFVGVLIFFSSVSKVFSEVRASADQVFSVLQESTFQIRIVEVKSDSQIALGTGFLIANNRIATNYHVVSDNVLEPQQYRIEIKAKSKVYLLKVVTVDVVHDLAILEFEDGFLEKPFILAEKAPKNGEIIYSLGNPHNLGLTIVEGNYNGLVENKFIDRIHFSGAINSGMSGGPAVNDQLEVVGINVATGGNQVGFLVPVKYLSALIVKGQQLPENFNILEDMSLQIDQSTSAMIEVLLASDWPPELMGTAIVPGNQVSWLTCWGNSKDDKESGMLKISRGCNNGDNIYINHHFTSGYFEYEYGYYEALSWPSAAFYRFLQKETAGARPANMATKEDVANFECVDKILATKRTSASLEVKQSTPMSRRVSFCVRPYKQLPKLYDVFFLGVSQDKERKGVTDHFTISGVSKESALLFLERFVGVLGWE